MRAVTVVLVAVLALAGAVPATGEPQDSDVDAARDPDYAAGKEAIASKDWRRAVERFERVVRREPDNADVQNYLGFAYRNLGDLPCALLHYRHALEINPRHRGAHEYAGEAQLMAGNLDKALEHLAAPRQICLMPCEELTDLERAITAYRARTGR
jgi:Flp pilus assembly protein TadD